MDIPKRSVQRLRHLASQYLFEKNPVNSFFQRAEGLNAAFPSTMSWHWATDRPTLEIFAEAAHPILALNEVLVSERFCMCDEETF